ncbi:MAG: ABC transporter substrate-binding protein [Clostridiales bacterium]|nr:ABC transporter substrate-binding protein [Candidatus Equinaster intestinalis]
MKKIIAVVCAAALALSLAACKTEKTQAPVKVYMINGPTGIGAVNLMEKAEKGETENSYSFSVVTEPNEIVAKLSSGDADIAAVATNLAAKIYNKTNGGVSVLAVNTLGVLDIVTNGTEIQKLTDLKGKKVYSTGKGANPELIINYLLAKNGMSDKDFNMTYMADGTELLTVFAKEKDAVIIAPEPVASSITAKYETSKIGLSLTDEWKKVSSDSSLMMGCVVVRNDFLSRNPETVKAFLKEYEASANAANENADSSAALCEKYGIVAKAAIAKKAMPGCNICFVTGEEMKTGLSGYLKVLFDYDKTSVGGKLPADDFYYAYEK